jgi:hypothetical protein
MIGQRIKELEDTQTVSYLTYTWLVFITLSKNPYYSTD